MRFGDRVEIEQILDHTAPDKFPVCSLIHEIVQSDLLREQPGQGPEPLGNK